MQEKKIDTIQHTFIIKTDNKLVVGGNYINIINTINEKHTMNIILNGKRLEGFPLRSGTK